MGKDNDVVSVNISGIQEEDEFAKGIINNEIKKVLEKLGKMTDVSQLNIQVDSYHKDGNKKKYSIKGRIVTANGDFFADDHDWDLTKTLKGVLDKIEREVMKKSEKSKVYRIGP